MSAVLEQLGPIQKLDFSHSLGDFSCGKDPLDRFLQRFAFLSQRSGAANTYVICRNLSRVVGYYSLCNSSVEYEKAPERVRKGLAKHPIPIVLLARLAVDKTEQGRGLGKALLKDVLLRTTLAADIVGIRALVVHAKDEQARAWYASFDFEPSPTDPYHLSLLLKDVRAILAR